VALLIAGVTAPTLMAAGSTAAVDPSAFVARYVELHAKGDIEGLLALHTPDSEFDLHGQEPIRGTEQLRKLLEWDAALGSRLEIDGATRDGDDLVLGAIVERNAFFAAVGVPEVRYLPGTRMTLRDGLVARTVPAALEPESQERLRRAVSEAVAWLRAHRPAELEIWMPGGHFRHGADSARWWLGVLDDWRAAREEGPDAEAAERLGRRLMAIWESGDTEELATFVAPDAVYVENVNGERFEGPEGFARYVGHVHGWARDVRMVLERVTAGGRHALFEWKMKAVQDRPVGDRVLVATNREVEIRGATLVEVRDGRIVRAADDLDALGFVLSLGGRVELPGGKVLERP
jgi:ketosteroid isomerase-like protein